MKIFKASEIKEIDRYTIENEPISSIGLMQRAAQAFADKLTNIFLSDYSVKIFAGKGNNGGDAYFVAKILLEKGFNVLLFACENNEHLSTDCEKAKELFVKEYPENLISIDENSTMPDFSTQDLIIDGLFGTGLKKPIDGFYANLIQHINQSGCCIVSIDIPSGLMGDFFFYENEENIIHANYTFTFQFPKLCFFFSENYKYTGNWEVLNIGLHPSIIEQKNTNSYYIDSELISNITKKRDKFSHKGNFGHALLIGGSFGKIGAIVLASKACLRAGVGLLTSHIPECGYVVLQTSVPEAMVSVDKNKKYFSDFIDTTCYTTLGIGVGLGKEQESVDALKHLLTNFHSPCVFDADALNIFSEHRELLNSVPKNSIFTPHPKEFERLAGKSENSYHRLEMLISFAKKHHVYVVLKGAHSIIARPDGSCWFNSTGNPGMATAGSGDVLLGVISALLAQDYSPFEAAVIGTYFHGLAGDRAAKKHTENGLIASDIIEELKIKI